MPYSTDHAAACLTINLNALTENYRLLAKKVAPANCAAVVKANAYGLGAQKVAPALYQTGCRLFFVATLDEAIDLRHTLPDATIHLFHGVARNEAPILDEHRIIPVLNTLAQVELWQDHAKAKEKQLPAILHLDTGMTRLGISTQDVKSLDSLEHFSIHYIMSHLACADEPNHTHNQYQKTQLEQFRQLFDTAYPVSFANSYGIFLDASFHYDLARPGAALYGINPQPDLAENPMNPVVTLTSRIMQLRTLEQDADIGYGASYHAKKGARLAVIPIGYADGYLRAAGNQGYCMIAGHKAPIAGRVSMDMTILDISDIPEHLVTYDTEVEVIGEHCTIDTVATHSNTIGYELLTRLGSRYKRIYTE